MQITGKRLRDKQVDILIESVDDLWYLQKILHKDDIIIGEANRKVQINDKGVTSRKQGKVKLSIQTIDVDLDSKIVRVNGTIIEGSEWFPQGSFQNVGLEVGSICTIEKEWGQINLLQIEQACAPQYNVLFLLFDRDDAYFYKRKGSTYETLTNIKSDLNRKYNLNNNESSYFKQIQDALTKQDHKLDLICIGSPAFYHDTRFTTKTKQIRFDITELNHESCTQMLRDKQVASILKKDVTIKLAQCVNRLKQHLASNTKVVYGPQEVKQQSENGAVEVLLVSEKKIKQDRDFVEECMKIVEKMKGDTLIVPDKTDESKMVDGLGGLIALLRY